jgi:hypothetical protein
MTDTFSALLVVAGAALLGLTAAGQASAQLSGLPALEPAVDELKAELDLTDRQVEDAKSLVTAEMVRVTAAVESFGGITFDSVLDLLVEARATRDELIPALRRILTHDQIERLAKLPKAHEVYLAAMSGWLTEAQLAKLRDRLGLTEAQIPAIRSVLLGQYREAVRIAEGFVRRADDKSMQETVLDAVVDLRTIQRTTERGIERELSDEQKASFQSYRDDPRKSGPGQRIESEREERTLGREGRPPVEDRDGVLRDRQKYPAIFEADEPMLTDPDEIYPGQVSHIPQTV